MVQKLRVHLPLLRVTERGMLPLLADRARSECARSMRAVGSTYTNFAVIELEGEEERAPTEATSLIS
jgi:hypothetical protein